MNQQPPQQPQTIQPQQVPETWNITALTGGKVVIEIHHLSGVHVSFADADVAEQIGQLIVSTARQAKTGLILPPTPVVSAQLLPPTANGKH